MLWFFWQRKGTLRKQSCRRFVHPTTQPFVSFFISGKFCLVSNLTQRFGSLEVMLANREVQRSNPISRTQALNFKHKNSFHGPNQVTKMTSSPTVAFQGNESTPSLPSNEFFHSWLGGPVLFPFSYYPYSDWEAW